MSLLTRYTLPAERLRGCKWADNFESAALVEKSSGIVVGAPVFSASDGVTLDGINDYLQYHLTGREFFHDPLSIVIRFTPEFEADEDAFRAFFDATDGGGGNLYRMHKRDNASNNILRLNLGNTLVMDIAEIAYSPYWDVGQRNTLIISSTSTDTTVYLQGHVIGTSAIIWSPMPDVDLYVGALAPGGNSFSGTVHSLQIYHAKLSPDEVADISNNETYHYPEKSTGIWPLTMALHDPGNTLSKDGLGRDRPLNFFPGNPPDKLDQHGYHFDGALQSMLAPVEVAPVNDFSIQCEVAPEDIAGASEVIIGQGNMLHNDDAFGLYWDAGVLYFFMSDTGRVDLGQFTLILSNALADNQRFYITATYHYVGSGTSQMRLYVNDMAPITSDVARGPIWQSSETTMVMVTAKGALYDLAYYDSALTRTQHLDFMARQRQRINQK